MTDSQLARVSSNKAPIWGLRPNFYYRQTVADLLMWGAPLARGWVCHLSAQSFSSPSPVGLVNFFFSLTRYSGKLSCSNVSVNRVEVTFNSTVLRFLAVTVLLTVRCHGYHLLIR